MRYGTSRQKIRASLDALMDLMLFLEETGAPLGAADFGVFLEGRTGAGKSELAALALMQVCVILTPLALLGLFVGRRKTKEIASDA